MLFAGHGGEEITEEEIPLVFGQVLVITRITTKVYFDRQKALMREFLDHLPEATRRRALRTLDNHDPGEWFGVVDSTLGGIIRGINLSNNRLGGLIPGKIGQLNGLKELNLSNNNLTGRIPTELGNLIKLHNLLLSGNYLRGGLPHGFSYRNKNTDTKAVIAVFSAILVMKLVIDGFI